MLALEGIGLSAAYLQIEEGSQIGYLLLDSLQSNHVVQLLQAFRIVYGLRCLVGDVDHLDGHQFLIGKHGDVDLLQAFCLLGTNLVKELAHGAAIGEVLVAGVVKLGNHLQHQFLGIWCKAVFLFLGKHFHNLEELFGRVVVDVEEVVEAAAESDVDAEQVVHLLTIACSDDHKLAAVVLHALHQLLQSLSALLVLVAAIAEGCKGISLVNEENATHSLVAQTVHHLGRLTLIGADHL